MVTPLSTDRIDAAVAAGAEALFARRRPDGVFSPDATEDRFSPANTALALIALHLAQATGPETARGVDRLVKAQRDSGGWAMRGVPDEVLTTAVVTDALDLVAPGRADPAVRAGRQRLTQLGGPEALPEPVMAGLIRQFGALAGRLDEAALPRLPLELLLLPGPARRLLSLRLPILASMALGQATVRRRTQGLVRRRFNALARPAALAIVREAYEREGGSGAFSTDPWLTGLICVGTARSGLAPDIVRAAAGWLRSAADADGGWELMPLDVTWSSFAASALLEAGYAQDPRLTPTRAMFHGRQQNTPFAALGCPPGYWGFSSAHSWPMALETAEISSVLLRLPGGDDDPHVRRGIDWLTRTQDSAGSWSLAVRNSKPGGFGPCPQMTAKAVRALLDHGAGAGDRRVAKAVRWLIAQQRADGSYEALWYRGRTAGTSVVLETLCRTVGAAHPAAARASAWLLRAQHDDGSWGGASAGEDGAAPGTVEDTAWALYALLAAGHDPGSRPVTAAAHHLTDAQRPDGGWAGSPVNEYIRFCYRYADDLIASGLALRALAGLRTASLRPVDRPAEGSA
ncbi:prenyltransferase/squalene oxidase repeat-containing protein [Streptomyces sp. NPDC021212]|uniref:prenyltransferase/squalene oxidase repeat-containing protein n=1 Tax=Streptomyces sp. NPDC021212 TaxID=3365118 RepID=UPI0037AAD352